MGGRKRKKPDGIDFKTMMKDPVGKWLWAPVIIAVLVYFGLAIFATLAQADNTVPAWIYGSGAIISAVIYYAVQLKTLFWDRDGSSTKSTRIEARVGDQTASGSMVGPVIRGNKNVVTVIQSSTERDRNQAQERTEEQKTKT